MKNEAGNILELKACGKNFGGLTAVSALEIAIGPRDLLGMIGPNGAGKTTVFNMITGVYQPTSGRVLFDGKNIVGLKPYQIAALGIGRTFQNIRLFPSLTVFENIQVSLVKSLRHGFSHSTLQLRSFHEEERAVRAAIVELLEIFNLTQVMNEPAAGMNATEKVELMRLIRLVKERFDIAILLIEHDMKVVMGICERIVVLDYGIKIAEGPPDAIRNNPSVIEAYLGEQAA